MSGVRAADLLFERVERVAGRVVVDVHGEVDVLLHGRSVDEEVRHDPRHRLRDRKLHAFRHLQSLGAKMEEAERKMTNRGEPTHSDTHAKLRRHTARAPVAAKKELTSSQNSLYHSEDRSVIVRSVWYKSSR